MFGGLKSLGHGVHIHAIGKQSGNIQVSRVWNVGYLVNGIFLHPRWFVIAYLEPIFSTILLQFTVLQTLRILGRY
jgi:hypothetical protein